MKHPALLLLIAFLGSLLLSGCETTTSKNETAILDAGQQLPADIDAERLQPGLSVLYFNGFYRRIGEMPKGEQAIRRGIPGPPITELNHRFGEENIFDSNRSTGVGMQMTGYLHLEEPGRYLFKAVSNDGIKVVMGGKTIISDPQVHKARESQPGEFETAQAGWVPVTVRYFQRKGTATLELHWQPPGSDRFSIVPASAYAHLPE